MFTPTPRSKSSFPTYWLSWQLRSYPGTLQACCLMSPLQLAKGIVFSCSFTLLTNPFYFFFPLRKPHSTQHNFPGSWKCREMVWSGPVCVDLNMGSMAALLWQTQSKAVCFFQTSGKYTVPSRGNIYIHFLFLSIYVVSLFSRLSPTSLSAQF